MQCQICGGLLTKILNNVHDFHADSLLRLFGGRADVGRAGDIGMRLQRLIGSGFIHVLTALQICAHDQIVLHFTVYCRIDNLY